MPATPPTMIGEAEPAALAELALDEPDVELDPPELLQAAATNGTAKPATAKRTSRERPPLTTSTPSASS
jgi:hypothetical protein